MPVATKSANVAAAIAAHVDQANPHNQYLLASGVSAYGATLIDDADAATARATLELGTAATLAVGTGANNVVQLDGSARLPAVDGSQLTGVTATATPGGGTTHVQYNNGGTLAGHSGMTYNGSGQLTLTGRLVAPAWRPASDSTTALQVQTAGGTPAVTVDTTNKYLTVANALGVGITADAATAILYVATDSGVFTRSAAFLRANADGLSGPNFTLRRCRGTIASPSNAITGDSLGYFRGEAYISSGWRSGGQFSFELNGTLSSTSVPTDFVVRLNASGESASFGTERFRITGIGYTVIGAHTTSPTALLDLAASTTARASLRIRSGTAPTSPNDGDVWNNGNSMAMRVNGTSAVNTDGGLDVWMQSTSNPRNVGRLLWRYTDKTDATRVTEGALTAYYIGTEHKAIRWRGGSGGPLLSFYDVSTPIARQTLATGAGASVDDVITALQNLGLVKQS